MKLFPPAPEQRKEAFAYVVKIKGKKESEFTAVRAASNGAKNVAWMLLLFTPVAYKNESWVLFFFLFGLSFWFFITGMKTERLLDLFEPTELNKSEPVEVVNASSAARLSENHLHD